MCTKILSLETRYMYRKLGTQIEIESVVTQTCTSAVKLNRMHVHVTMLVSVSICTIIRPFVTCITGVASVQYTSVGVLIRKYAIR